MDLAVKWNEVINNPFFKDAPFKVELNKFGQILMSPASNKHGILQNKVARQIDDNTKGGVIIIECSILTSDGVKVADVAWASDKFMSEFGEVTPFPKAPEICVEVISPGNTKGEIEHKIRLYLEKGASEVWIVKDNGEHEFYSHTGKIAVSQFAEKLTF